MCVCVCVCIYDYMICNQEVFYLKKKRMFEKKNILTELFMYKLRNTYSKLWIIFVKCTKHISNNSD